MSDRDGLDADTLTSAHRMFDLARDGQADRLAAEIDAGLPVNLTNNNGDSLLILASYYARLDTVSALLARGADPQRSTTEAEVGV